ncbi:hypothetical protein ABIB62_001226 [Mucilaginibacter sp. UYP25]|uniref:hypothetical protein n=1 Tax=unclassified Mucilaginibacter TaxID=2617802 RepID=UPI0033923E25
MEDNSKQEKPKETGKVIVVSAELLAKNKGDLTPKERCEADHAGRCGSCDNDGYFTPCA